MGRITLDQLDKRYDNGFHAVDRLTLDIDDGEFLVLVGPSGSGKSTALRMVAGLEDITGGELRIDDRRVNEAHPKDRDVAMVFQNYALYPHMTVAKNIAYALRLAKVPKAEIARRVEETAAILELSDLLDRKPAQLSGGQRQRVAMGRAIVRQPAVFLMDEPLSNLDAKLRVQMRAQIGRLQKDLGVTTVYVTHDQVEAMTMGDRVAVLNHGVLQQVDSPQALYDHPANIFVATFIGSPSMNLYEAQLSGPVDAAVAEIGPHQLPIPERLFERRPSLRQYLGRTVALGIRPEDLEDVRLLPEDRPRGAVLEVAVSLVEALGAELIVHSEIDGAAVSGGDPDLDETGTAAAPSSGGRGQASLLARVGPRSTVRRGDRVRLAVDVDRLYVFDLATGLAIDEDAAS